MSSTLLHSYPFLESVPQGRLCSMTSCSPSRARKANYRKCPRTAVFKQHQPRVLPRLAGGRGKNSRSVKPSAAGDSIFCGRISSRTYPQADPRDSSLLWTIVEGVKSQRRNAKDIIFDRKSAATRAAAATSAATTSGQGSLVGSSGIPTDNNAICISFLSSTQCKLGKNFHYTHRSSSD